MTQYELPTDRTTTAWRGLSFLRTGAELLLGISFITAMAFGGFGAVVHQTSVVAELAAIVFCCSLVCVLVNWFTVSEDEGARGHKGWD
jgi:hypothetical protein